MKFTGRHAAALALATTMIGGFEGLRNYAYKDPVGIPTICFGETRNVHMGDFRTTDQCRDMLGTRVVEFAKGVDRCLDPVAVSDKVYGADVSIAYNIGLGAFCGSTLVRLQKAGQTRASCDQFSLWDKARGIALPGLTKRRAEERALCIAGA